MGNFYDTQEEVFFTYSFAIPTDCKSTMWVAALYVW